jgi:hypothetical protein
VLPGRAGPNGRLRAGGVEIAAIGLDLPPETPVEWSIHPEHVEIGPHGAHPATVVDAAELGAATAVRLRIGDGVDLQARVSGRRRWQLGERCQVDLPADVIAVWPAGPAGTAPAAVAEDGPVGAPR